MKRDGRLTRMPKLCESSIEIMAIEELCDLGYTYITGPDIAPDTLTSERKSYADVLLVERLKNAMLRINSNIPASTIDDAVKKILRISSPNLLTDNEAFHKMLVDGVPVEYRKDGNLVGDYVKICDFRADGLINNEFLVINQFTVIENNNNKRPDILL